MTEVAIRSGLYVGEVMHQRFAPRPHRLAYSLFQTLFDLDHLAADLDRLRLCSHNRFNLFSFYDRDHGPIQSEAGRGSLLERVRSLLADHGLSQPGDRIFLLAMPRVLGFVFNPISLYFVQGADGALKAIIYEVNNTFGDRHSYVRPVEQTGKVIHQHSPKKLHVSPFMAMNMVYDFDLIAPETRFILKIRLREHTENDGLKDMLLASFTAERQDLSDRVLWRLFWAMPLMTLKVVVGIHWEAVRLMVKGIGLKPKPPTHKSSVSL